MSVMRALHRALGILRPTVLGPATLDLALLAGIAFVWVVAARPAETTPAQTAVEILRRAGLLLALGAVRVHAEPAGSAADACPVSGPQRWLARSLYLIGMVGVAWGGLAFWVTVSVVEPVPVWGLTIEVAAVTVWTSSASEALRGRMQPLLAAAIAPLAVLASFAAWSFVAPAGWPPLVASADDGRWARSHVMWTVVLLIGVIISVSLARDPARRLVKGTVRPTDDAPPAESPTMDRSASGT